MFYADKRRMQSERRYNVKSVAGLCIMNGQQRKDIQPGLAVSIILKKDQRSGKLTRGIVMDILTSAPFHSRGIKVRLEDGRVGRVQVLVAGAEA